MDSYRKPYRVGLIQMSMQAEVKANVQAARDGIRRAAEGGAAVCCLPELFHRPYPCQSENPDRFDWAEPIPGPSTRALAETARETDCWVLAGLFERQAAGVYYNAVATIDPAGRIRCAYRKMHLPDDPGFYEKYYFSPGDRGFVTFAGPFGRVGLLICWDQWFPEAARLTALQGADVLFYPTAIGRLLGEDPAEGQEQLRAWQAVQRGHAVANGVYVAAVNRVGVERGETNGDGIDFWGRSFLFDPMGNTVAEAGGDAEVLVAEVDPQRIERVRRTWPFLRDRRIDAYDAITRRFDPPDDEPQAP